MKGSDSDHLDTFVNFNQKYHKAGFIRQVTVLLRKNFNVTFRKWNFVMAHVLTLTLVCLIIMFINYLTKYSYENEPSRIYPVQTVDNIRKCDFHPTCKSLGYILIGDEQPWVNYVIENIANKTGFKREEDIKLLYKGDNITQALTDVKKKNNNSFSTIVILCTSSFVIADQTVPCTTFGAYTYWLLYNQTLVKQNFLDNMNAPLKLSMEALRTARMVENALSNYILIHDYGLQDVNIEHNYTSQDYPKVQSRMLVDFDTSSSQGPFWFFIPIMVSFLNLNTEIINEKERRLRQGLMLFGVSSAAYWLSWVIFTIIFDLFYALLITASGYICRFSFFVNCPFHLLYIPFFLTLFSNHLLGFVLCTLVADNKAGSKYGYSVMLISIFYQIFFSNGLFLELIYTEEKPWGIYALYYFMAANPSFHFANIIVNIIYEAGNHFNTQTTMWEKGNPYTWEKYKSEVSGSLFSRPYTKPSPLESNYRILYNAAVFLILFWVFDNIIPSNRGFPRNPFKDLFNFIRGGSDKSVSLVVADSAEGNQDQALGDRAGELRKQIVVESEKCINGIVMQNLWKSYKFSCSRGKDPRSDWALRDVSLQIRQGELLGLLGPNGAGKTTMIGIMSGILEQTRGNFFSYGMNSETHQEDIRAITSVCPQFDILWDELTVEDHIKLVCMIKGVNSQEIPILAETLLSIVNLSSTLHEKISNLSGGMKRRISIALATIGNPAILIFDEPTTGLDPENRRIIWKFINRLKESQRTILLTTHLLEEADILSDRIAILSYGQIKVVGNSSELKRKIGSGFKLNLIIKENEEKAEVKVKQYVTSLIKEAHLLDESAGSLLYSIPFNCTDEITKFLYDFEKNEDIKQMVEDVSISNSTLEEVFINITREDDTSPRHNTLHEEHVSLEDRNLNH